MSAKIVRLSEHISLTLLLARPGLRLLYAGSLAKERKYAQELEKTAEKALAHYKRDTQVVYMIAEGYQLMGKKDEATELLEEHLEIRPWDVHCLYQLGLIYQERREFEKALDCYERSLKSIEEYSQVFRESFSRLISDSRDQVLEEMGVNQRGDKM